MEIFGRELPYPHEAFQKEVYRMEWLEWLKAAVLGIVEGITEWLPISSTGHMILVDQFLSLNQSDSFKEMFFVVIQLGAILAVVVLYWGRLWPFSTNRREHYIKKDVWSMWFKVLVAVIPAVIASVFDDWFNDHFYTPTVIAVALIVYGVLFIWMENAYKGRRFRYRSISDMTYGVAFGIGLFQVLAMIPGTSRSGATILGAMLLGTSRTVAAEFTFFLAIPVMFGASLLKLVKFGLTFTSLEIQVLVIGMVTAFLVSMLAIKFLMGYIKKHDFKVFGYYRIILGALVLLYFLVLNPGAAVS